MRRRLVLVSALALLGVLVTAGPAAAKGGGGGSHNRRISLTGALVVATGEVVNDQVVSVDGPVTVAGRVNDEVFVGRGRLTIGGHVTGDVLVVDGDATITGRVDGDITALHGRVTVQTGGSVHGDVTSSTAPRAAPGTVRGHVKTLDVTTVFTGFVFLFLVLLWVAVTVSVGILGLLFVLILPRGADAVVLAGRRVGASIATGLLVGILGPVLGIGIVSTVFGLPLGTALVGTMALLAPLGYASSALILGRLMVQGPRARARIGAFVAGFAILRVVALIPVLGFMGWYLACFYGLGAITIAGWRAGRGRPSSSATAVSAAPAGAPTEPETAARVDTPAPEKRPPARPRPTRAAPKKATPKKASKQTATKTAKKTARYPSTPRATKKAPVRKPARTSRAPAKKGTGRASATPRKAAAARRSRPAAKRSTAGRASGAGRRPPRPAASRARRSR